MTGVYLFNLVLGGILFGWGLAVDDSYLWFAGVLLAIFNALPFIPWAEGSPISDADHPDGPAL